MEETPETDSEAMGHHQIEEDMVSLGQACDRDVRTSLPIPRSPGLTRKTVDTCAPN